MSGATVPRGHVGPRDGSRMERNSVSCLKCSRLKTRKPGEQIIMKMAPTDIEAPLDFAGGIGSRGKAKFSVTVLRLKMTPELELLWATVPVGSKVRFRAKLGV